MVHAQDCISADAVPGCVRTVHHLDTFSTPALAACHERAIVGPRALVCVSAAVAAEVATGWGRIATVVPNGVDAARFAAAAGPAGDSGRRAWRDRLGRCVLAEGGIEPRKGTLDLVEAMAAVQARRPDLSFVVAGGETLCDYRGHRAAVEARAAELGVQPVVLGPVPDEALPTLVAAADVFAFPLTKEGFGLAATEALAAGVPVVTRDLPVPRAVFGGAATFVGDAGALADGLLTAALRADPARRSAGWQLADRHTWDAAATEHRQLYRSLC